MQETWVQSLGCEVPLKKEMAPHSSILAWRIPWTEEPGRLQSMGSQSVGCGWVTSLFFYDWKTPFWKVRSLGYTSSVAESFHYEKSLGQASFKTPYVMGTGSRLRTPPGADWTKLNDRVIHFQWPLRPFPVGLLNKHLAWRFEVRAFYFQH